MESARGSIRRFSTNSTGSSFAKRSILQADLDDFMVKYNNERTHQGKHGKKNIPMHTFIDGKQLFTEKNLNGMLAAY